jgi:uncharacterized protein
MSSSSDLGVPKELGVGAFVAIAVLGFVVGEFLGAVFEAMGASLSHFPGGVSALSKLSSPPWWANATGLIGLWCGFGLAIFLTYRPGGLRPLVQQWHVRWSDAQYVVLGVAAQFVIDFAYKLCNVHSLNGPVNHLFGGARGIQFAFIAVMTTFAAPVMEEWFFRGVIYRALAEKSAVASKTLRLGVAIAFSAIAFGAAHGEAKQFVGLSALGALLAYVVHRTKRLTPSVLTHVSFNAVALVSLMLQRSGH